VTDALARTCEGKARDDLLWCTRDGNPLMPPAPSSSWLAFAVRRCQAADPEFPRISAHALRHTAASLAISAGANVKAVQRMLGHSSAAMTLDVYADLFDSDMDAVADALDQRYSQAVGIAMEGARR
jgi:integrase